MLSPSQMEKALKLNPVYGQQLGWTAQYVKVLEVLGTATSASAEVFAQAVADWQAGKPPLTPDGILGPNTWKKLKPLVSAGPTTPPGPPSGSGPAWLRYAYDEMVRWDAEIAAWDAKKAKHAEQHVDWDEKYFMASPYWGAKSHADGEVPGKNNMHWCAAFVNWCLHRAGYSHTGSAGAGSFQSRYQWQFEALKEPRQGCVIVVGNSSAEHVAFLWSWSGLPSNPKGDVEMPWGRSMQIIGGNQSDRITITSNRRKLLAGRGQNGVTSPYFWPLVGSGCTISSVPTDQDHYCGKNPV